MKQQNTVYIYILNPKTIYILIQLIISTTSIQPLYHIRNATRPTLQFTVIISRVFIIKKLYLVLSVVSSRSRRADDDHDDAWRNG